MTMEYNPTDEQKQELGSDNINVSSNFSNSLLHNFNEINENILDLGTIIDELVNLISNETSERREKEIRKQHILDHIDNYGIIPQEFYNLLLNDQNNLNSIYLFGYFKYGPVRFGDV